MSPAGISPDVKAVVGAVDALTTQVRRLADAQQTPVVGQVDATDDDATTADDGARYRLARAQDAAALHRKGLISDGELNAVFATTAEALAERCEHDGPHPGFTCGEVDQTRLFWEAQWALDTDIQNLWAQIRLRNGQWRDAKRELAEAQAAIERVRALHTRVLRMEALVCARCGHDWPCDTIRALDGTEQPTTTKG